MSDILILRVIIPTNNHQRNHQRIQTRSQMKMRIWNQFLLNSLCCLCYYMLS